MYDLPVVMLERRRGKHSGRFLERRYPIRYVNAKFGAMR
jgi:hypothetical protein